MGVFGKRWRRDNPLPRSPEVEHLGTWERQARPRRHEGQWAEQAMERYWCIRCGGVIADGAPYLCGECRK